MQIKFKSLKLQNFKSHQDLTVNFGEHTVITGDNDKGKSSIGEAITWLLYGTDMYGVKMTGKLDPEPTTYEADLTSVSLLMEVDGKDLLFEREVKNGKTKYSFNGVPGTKATEFSEIVTSLFNKDLFLSLFNPKYFFTLHWEKQRGMILQYVPAPANKEVLKELPEAQAKKLAELVKKHSLDDLEKIHRANKTKLDKQYIAAQSRTKTLKEQFEDNAPKVPLESLHAELSVLTKQRKEIEKVTDAAGETNGRINVLQNQIKKLVDERDQMKERFYHLKEEKIEEHCRTCKQPLQDEAVQAVEADKQRRIDEFKKQYNSVVAKRKELEAELATLEYVDVSEQLEKARQLQYKINSIEREIQKHSEFEVMQKHVKEAAETEKKTLESLNESIFIIDSIKDFKSKEAELQCKKVQDLFDTLSIRLFKEQKNGEFKADFGIQDDRGINYEALSNSGKTRAGLELREILSQQSEIILPCFVDDKESITKFKEPTGQLIMARVVAGQNLKIEVEK